jgi:hypothetical protein
MSNGTKAIMANITGGKIMKVRWNACYAASNILRKEEEEGQWRTDLINCLLDMVINFHNFKVINAPCERAIHGGSIVGQLSVRPMGDRSQSLIGQKSGFRGYTEIEPVFNYRGVTVIEVEIFHEIEVSNYWDA